MKKIIFTLAIIAGFTYTGSAQCIVGNCHDGFGTYEWENGNVYRGEWKGGKQNGVGTMKFENGDTFSGDYLEGKMEGKGTYMWANGDRYQGFFQEDQPHHQGRYTWSVDDSYYNGTIAEGGLVNMEVQSAAVTPEKD